MNLRQFTMDKRMATLDVKMRSFMPAALSQENRCDLEEATHTHPWQQFPALLGPFFWREKGT